MRKSVVLWFVLAVMFFLSGISFAQEAEVAGALSQEKIVAVATETVRAKGYKLDDVRILYDDGNRLWAEVSGKFSELDKSPNFGIFKKGFMKNYRTVYFDFKDPLPDLWVFVDKDTGEVLEIYQLQ
jgi:hypothetical protein